MQALPLLDVRTRQRWRAWLSRNHAASEGVWLVLHKNHTGVKSLSHEELLSEALCFGWIDSLVRRLDEDRYAIKVTPRRPTSKWSDINRQRWAQLQAAGLLAPAGVAAAPTGNTYAPRPVIPVLPGYIAAAIKARGPAWKFFQSLTDRERRNFVVWIETAKRPETRQRRLLESLDLLAAGKRLGLK
jgi:uncharacterized protein YdeI (YjbR/CyaY-like superfamily)